MQSYKNAGVNVEAGYKAVELMRDSVARTSIDGVMSSLGGFGGLFDLNAAEKAIKEPVLVSGTDGVGTKLKLAFIMDKHDTIGQDCVAMCVNDVLCSGARPLFFLDYLAVGKNYPEKIAEIVGGVARGCEAAKCALIGGETAEMPGFYPEEEYDLAGFCVGIAEKKDVLKPKNVKVGDKLVAIPSSGVHSNGFSLIRKIFGLGDASARRRLEQYSEELGQTFGEALLEPTRIYVQPVLNALKSGYISAISHVTGGGFYENIPRMLPKGVTAKIEKSALKIHPVFAIIEDLGKIPAQDMFGIFNMGVGMVIATHKPDKIIEILGDDAYIMGEVAKGDGGVKIC
ncbi:MAG: phosphoribosylformylglycinamidine cyclo-ligase [Clostridiales bacterium]|nr:phosphoribosylformylglycinamidine cyclo-ligase [Clostridiales bacterium]